MEQISSREVIRVFENRFRQRLLKAQINPELVEYTARYLRRLRFVKKLAEKGAKFYLRNGDEGVETYLPIEKRYIKFLGIVKRFLNYLHLFRASDDVFLDTSLALHRKTLCIYVGNAIPTFFPQISDGDVSITMDAKDFEKILSRVRGYSKLLIDNGVDVELPPRLPEGVDHVVVSKKFPGPAMFTDFWWSGITLFTPYYIWRPITEAERGRDEESRREVEEGERRVKEIIGRSKLLFSYDGHDFYEVEPSLLNLGDIAEKAYITTSYMFIRCYDYRRLGLSAPLNFLAASSLLSERGISSDTMYVLRPYLPGEVAERLPKSVLGFSIANHEILILPKSFKKLPKPKLAKPVITRKRLILVKP